MAEYGDFDSESELNRTRLVGVVLDVAGWLTAAAALGWAIYRILNMSAAAGPDLSTIVLGLVAALGAAAFLWGLAEVIRRMLALQQGQQRSSEPRAASTPRAGRESAFTAEDSDRLNELVVLIREVRDISLLSEEQRRMRLEAQGRAVLGVTMRDVPVLLREHNWLEARARVQAARERFPMFKEWDELEKQIEQMRTQVEEHDLAAAERQIQDLKMLGAHDRVAEVINELLERHPDSVRAHELAQRDREERSRADAEKRAKMLAHVQESANRREWNAALAVANQLIREYPKSTEAQSLKLDLPRLQENAEILSRKHLESEYAAYIRQHQYERALAIARQVIDEYPQSPQAAALREQIPKLEQRAAIAAGM